MLNTRLTHHSEKMWITAVIVALICCSETQAGVSCDAALGECKQRSTSWISCYEEKIEICQMRGRLFSFIRMMVNSSQEVEAGPNPWYQVRIPSSALQNSRGKALDNEVLVVMTVIESSHFKLTNRSSRATRLKLPPRKDGTVMGGFVLVVKTGNQPVRNLPQPVRLTFKHDKQMNNGTCVYWFEVPSGDGTGYWSTDGCETENTGTEFICSCNHLSFFAVLVNPELSVDEKSADTFTYINYIGSALSFIFTTISLVIYACLQRRRPEKAVGVHMQLTGALLLLHFSYLLSCLWVWLNPEDEGWVCRGLGFFLHWSLLATFTWTALEGFHLYLLLVRVFNIYVRKYLLKLSLVGWGLPTLTVLVCAISSVYGKFKLKTSDENIPNSTVQICWMSSDFKHQLVVSYITTMALPCLVVLCNSCMLGVVIFKLWGMRRSSEGGGWHKMNGEKSSRLWKDCTTVLGLSWLLGLSWGLAGISFFMLGIYMFTILNSLQGVFVFLWSVALSCKSRSDDSSSSKDPSTSQKMITTSFNN
ncbi:adhesion G-protein coupled receptor G1-like isoform X2 [Cheilinus undulatus]|uniref:adhesion G-protein coupled receptor G1-like isoform X2 n=1 Tax=Cheilinus undulatus TaxID=241271 RepID=UPI001BD67BBF|nr:adhesion G-protein coupled receptor G1-like isoform X2 [Cheilinus undulatus]